jgi:hypothetical protein
VLNEDGKRLFGEQKYLEASRKFRDAIVLSPEGRFYFNLCFTLNFLERYREALDQCQAVHAAGGDARLIEKTDQLIVELEKRVPPPEPDPIGGGEPGFDPGGGVDPEPGPGPGGPPPPAGGPPPPGPANPFLHRSAIENPYRWSLGGEIGGLANLGVGRVTAGENYSDGGFHLRLFANFIVNEPQQLGLQAYVGFSNLEESRLNFLGERLSIFDIGGAVFIHRRLAPAVYLTPLVGAHISAQQPAQSFGEEAFVSAGFRGELSLAYVFGEQGQHAVSLSPALNLYLPASGANSGFDPSDFGLDKGSATVTVAVGYTARFSTPFGSSPLISLE